MMLLFYKDINLLGASFSTVAFALAGKLFENEKK